jgi:hypothetical protein
MIIFRENIPADDLILRKYVTGRRGGPFFFAEIIPAVIFLNNPPITANRRKS